MIPWALSQQSYITHWTSSGQTDYPIAEWPYDLVLGEGGVVYFTDQETVGSLNINTGAQPWSYEVPDVNNDVIDITAATADGGIATNLIDLSTNERSLVQIDSSGNSTQLTSLSSPSLTYSWSNQWFTISADPEPEQLVLPIAADTASLWAAPQGTSGNGASYALDALLTQQGATASGSTICPLCHLQSPACTTIPGTGSTYLLLIGDQGVNGGPGQDHDVKDLFKLAAQTQADNLASRGHRILACRVSNIEQFNLDLTQHGQIDGAVIYFGHSGLIGFRSSPHGPVTAVASEVFVGQGTGDDTNIAAYDVNYLSDIKTAYGGQNSIAPSAALTLSGCNEGEIVDDYYAQTTAAIAQLISNVINRGVYAYEVGVYFSNTDVYHDQSVMGATAPDPTDGLPVYVVPEGVPGRKPQLKPFCPNGSCPSN